LVSTFHLPFYSSGLLLFLIIPTLLSAIFLPKEKAIPDGPDSLNLFFKAEVKLLKN